MNNGKLNYSSYTLHLVEPFGTAHGIRDTTEGILVGISDGERIGYGEAFMPPYYDEDPATMEAFLDLIDVSRLLDFNSITKAYRYIDGLEEGNSGAKAAIDIALHDLVGKREGKSVSAMYGASERSFETSYTIGHDSIDKMLRKVSEAEDFSTLKIKLNGRDDLDIISAIAAITDQKLFVDVNQGWTDVEEALEKTKRLIEAGVLLIEQPFEKGMEKKAKALSDETGIPVIADEDVRDLSDITRLSSCYDGINIKLMKCGGIYSAVEMMEEARSHGMKILLGCMTESSIGISAAAQLAGLADWCDLDGNLLIKNDTCAGVRCAGGRLNPEGEKGIGITDDSRIRKLLNFEEDL